MFRFFGMRQVIRCNSFCSVSRFSLPSIYLGLPGFCHAVPVATASRLQKFPTGKKGIRPGGRPGSLPGRIADRSWFQRDSGICVIG